jgi:hypothetical protein
VVVVLGVSLGTGSHVSNVAGIFGIAAAVFGAPLLVWTLHGRHNDSTARLGAGLGFVAGGVTVFAVVMLADIVGALGMVVGLSATKSAGAMAVAVAVAVAFLVVIAWLDVDALRDLSPKRRGHVRIDIARLVATAAYAAFCVGVIVEVGAGPEPDAGVYTGILLLAPGALGAVVVTVAAAITRSAERRSDAHLISGA